MNHGIARTVTTAALALACAGATWLSWWGSQRPAPQASPGAGARKPDPAVDPRFAPRLLEIAGAYHGYRLVNAAPHWVPEMCRADPPPQPLLSRAAPTQAHGGKLYLLYASDLPAYRRAAAKDAQPSGQVLVKQSWLPRKVRASDATAGFPRVGGQDGSVYIPGERGPLFIMFKTESGADGTDAGWVYGTVTPDGRTVTSAGRVASCMGCHRHGTHDRLFGTRE